MRYFLVTYIKKANGQIDEQVAVSRTLKDRDHQMCNVILDYKSRKVDKCVIDGVSQERDWEKLHAYYQNYYPNLVDQLEEANKQEGQ